MLLSYFYKRNINSVGQNVRIHPKTSVYFGLENLSIGNDVSIPRFAHIFCTEAPFPIIYNKVVFGQAPTIVTGNHHIDEVVNLLYPIEQIYLREKFMTHRQRYEQKKS
jgi:acetyltransferase-like isoleucine patch superfamily enzyme